MISIQAIQKKLQQEGERGKDTHHYILEIDADTIEVAMMPKNCKDDTEYIEFSNEAELKSWLTGKEGSQSR